MQPIAINLLTDIVTTLAIHLLSRIFKLIPNQLITETELICNYRWRLYCAHPFRVYSTFVVILHEFKHDQQSKTCTVHCTLYLLTEDQLHLKTARWNYKQLLNVLDVAEKKR